VKLGYLGGVGSRAARRLDPVTHTFANAAERRLPSLRAPDRGGRVAAGGFITLLKTLPTIGRRSGDRRLAAPARARAAARCLRTERDPADHGRPGRVAVLVLGIAVLRSSPGAGFGSKLRIGLLVVFRVLLRDGREPGSSASSARRRTRSRA
jgi:hypothetical protein